MDLLGGFLLRDEVTDGFVFVMGHTREVIEHRDRSLPWCRAVELHVRADQLVGMDRRKAGEAFAGNLENLTAPERTIGAVAQIIEADAEDIFSSIHRVEDRAVTFLHTKHRHLIMLRKDFDGVGRRELRVEVTGDAVRLLVSLIERRDDLCSEAFTDLLRRFKPHGGRIKLKVIAGSCIDVFSVAHLRIPEDISLAGIRSEGDGDPAVFSVFFHYVGSIHSFTVYSRHGKRL